jgi:hypothetical protein
VFEGGKEWTNKATDHFWVLKFIKDAKVKPLINFNARPPVGTINYVKKDFGLKDFYALWFHGDVLSVAFTIVVPTKRRPDK